MASLSDDEIVPSPTISEDCSPGLLTIIAGNRFLIGASIRITALMLCVCFLIAESL